MALKRRRRKMEAASLWLLAAISTVRLANAWQQQHQQPPATENLWHHQQHHKTSSSQAAPQEQQEPQHSTSHFCSILPEDVSRQLKLCKLIRHSSSASEAVSHGASKGLAECRAQFARDRWNCTHSTGESNLLVSELAQSVGNKESAFVQAIAAAGIVHSIATACSAGSLSDCACDKSRVGPIKRQDEIWKWGGCSNNIRHGMLFAKHLVELLDAVHQHHFLSQHHNHQHQQHHHQLTHVRQRRSPGGSLIVSGGRQLRAGRPPLPVVQLSADTHPEELAFCRHNHSISQTTHKQLIKSLLAERSLERHQEIRLAVNMHNNKIGRMAVAKNMELRCRCHGLSGSCSLKTCWLTLPNFQVIGNYLKSKYEASVHIPSAFNLNKLIPLMDRAEISAILSNKWQQQQQPQSVGADGGAAELTGAAEGHGEPLSRKEESSRPEPEFAALVDGTLGPFQQQGAKSPGVVQKPLVPATSISNHKQPTLVPSNRSLPGEEELFVEMPVNTSPMSQQQYQALLRDMKLCNTITQPTGSGHLSARDLNQDELNLGQGASRLQHHRKQLHKQAHQQHELQAQQLKLANQVLSQMLHPHDKDALVHLHRSPAYCEPDARRGFPGIKSRLCSRDRNAPDSCDKLCCGRGSRTLTYKESYKCDCKFQYCCSINCSVCEQTMQVAVCN